METQPDEVIENFRLSLKHVIEDIVSYLPDTDEYRLVRGDLNDVKGSIYYTAPEVLTNSANKVHNILKKYLPLNTEDDTKNPKWLKNIRDRWNTYEEKKRDKSDKKPAP